MAAGDSAKGRRRIPPTPNNMSLSRFGQEIMQWGRGDDAAIARMVTIDAGHLAESGVNLDMMLAWERAMRRTLGPVAARSFARLLPSCLEARHDERRPAG